jgi:hypothetical protein
MASRRFRVFDRQGDGVGNDPLPPQGHPALLAPFRTDRHQNQGAGRTAQAVADFPQGHGLGSVAVDGGERVADFQAGAGGGSMAGHFLDNEASADLVDADTDAAVTFTLGPLVQGALGAGITGIGVQIGYQGIEDGLIDIFGRSRA